MNRLASLLPDWDPPSHPTPWGNTGLDSQTRKSAGGVGPTNQPVSTVAAAGVTGKSELVDTVAGAGSGPPPQARSVAAGGVGPTNRSVATVAAAGVTGKSESVDTVVGFGSGPPPKISARPDWLQGTFSAGSLDKFHEFLGVLERRCKEKFELKLDTPVVHGIRWDGYAVSANSLVVAYRQVEALQFQVWFSLPGQVCGSLSKQELLKLSSYLHYQQNLKLTRIDLALDDYGKTLDLQKIANAARAYEFSGAKVYAIVESGKKGEGKHGMSIVLGAPQSDKRLTVYDKSVESNGKIDAIRLELRLRDELAQQVWKELFSVDFCPEKVAAIILGSFSFLRKTDKNLSRAKLLDWWQQFLNYVKATPIKIRRVPKLRTLEKTMGWLRKQVATTLYAACRVSGVGLLYRLFELGEKRYQKNPHFKILEHSFKIGFTELLDSLQESGERFDTLLDAVA